MTKLRLTLFTAAVCLTAFAQPRPRPPIRIAVNDPRPVAAAAEELERQLGLVVTYEDPQWLAQSEVQEVTERVRTDLGAAPAFLRNLVPRIYVPRGGKMEFDLPRAALAGAAGGYRAGLLNELLLAHSSAGNPGTFRAQEGSSGRLHIVPLTARDRSERVVAQQPVLDRKISLDSRRYSGLDFMGTFTETLTRASGLRVEVGTIPIGTFARHSGVYGGADETARDLLARFLDGVGPNYSWQFFFDPVDRMYVLNIHWVAPKGPEEQR